MRQKERVKLPAVGGSSLLVIFTVLCLTVFALLGLGTVQAGQRLTDQAADSVSAYYEADLQAEQILAQLRDGQSVDGVVWDGDCCSYTCPVSDTQVLTVQVRLRDDGTYEILRWQTVSVTDWQADESITVWDGETVR